MLRRLSSRVRRPGPRVCLAGLVALAAAALSGCSGDPAPTADATPEEVLTLAREHLDDTSGVTIELSTDGLPDGVQGLVAATGTITHAPAFDGTLTVLVAGAEVEVPVVAVDGKVFAQLPLTIIWSDIDPAEYGAPDPAELISPDSGVSSLLAATTDVSRGDSVRGGAGNAEVLTEYTGTVPGDVMQQVIPSASGDSFEVAYSITDDAELREARLTGVFYPDSASMTYTVVLSDYGVSKDITAP